MKKNENRTNIGWKYIVVIEDDEEEQQFLIDSFKEVSPEYQIVCFNKGRKGLNYLQQAKANALPCLIILDYHLPDCKGSEVLARLQQIPQLKDIPVIIHSNANNIRPEDVVHAKALVQKAVTWNEMKENVAIFLFYSQELVVL